MAEITQTVGVEIIPEMTGNEKDFAIEDIASGYPHIGVSRKTTDYFADKYFEERRVNEARESATLEEKTKGFAKQFALNNRILKAFSDIGNLYGAGANYDKDPDYNMTDEYAINVLQANQLPIDYFGYIRKSNSRRQTRHLVRYFNDIERTKRYVNETITEGWQTTAAVSGSLIDVDFAVGFGLGASVKSLSLAKLVALDATAETALSIAKMSVDDKYRLEDAFIDVAIGTVVSGAGANLGKYLRRKALRDEVARSSSSKAFTQDTPDFDTIMKEADELKPKMSNEVDNFKKNIDEMLSEQSSKKYMSDEEIERLVAERNRRIVKSNEDAYWEARKTALAKNFSKNYEVNRKVFFAKQEKIANSAKLNKLANDIDNLKLKRTAALDKGKDVSKLDAEIKSLTKSFDDTLKAYTETHRPRRIEFC